jgi:hypothetical protein
MRRPILLLSAALAVFTAMAGGGAARGGETATEALWTNLASEDAPAAHRAIRALTRRPDEALALFRARLRLPKAAAVAVIDGLIRDLDSDRFAVRQKAAAELALLGHQAGPALRRALDDKPSLEMSKRLQALLDRLNAECLRGEELRAWRATEVLEEIGTDDACRVLETLVAGPPGSRVVEEASACLQRLARRKAAP